MKGESGVGCGFTCSSEEGSHLFFSTNERTTRMQDYGRAFSSKIAYLGSRLCNLKNTKCSPFQELHEQKEQVRTLHLVFGTRWRHSAAFYVCDCNSCRHTWAVVGIERITGKSRSRTASPSFLRHRLNWAVCCHSCVAIASLKEYQAKIC